MCRSRTLLAIVLASCSHEELLPTEEVVVPGHVGEPRFRSGQPAPIDDGNDLVSYVAQCEAVLGPIPEISCDPSNPSPGTFVTKIPVIVDGLPLGLSDDRDQSVLLEQRAESGEYVCDFPSIGGDFPCSVGSTLVQYSDPETPWIQWVGLCRGVPTDTPNYDRFIGNGLIGANEKTGEMCFFFGGNPDRDAPYDLPHLTSAATSAEALSPWLAPLDMPGSCLSCHPNNDPWVMTPWLQPSYMLDVLTDPDYGLRLPDGVELEDLLAARHVRQTPIGLKTMLPEPLPSNRTAWTEEEILGGEGEVLRRQYRAVGSSYVANEARGTVAPRTGSQPGSWRTNFRERLLLQPSESSCSNGCHALANENVVRMGDDSLGTKYATKYLTESMGHGTPGFAWMPPGSDISSLPQWVQRFEEAEPSIPAITECPIPRRLAFEDVEVSCDGDVARIEWTYANTYGTVPGRDDVRFDVVLSNGADAVDGNGVAQGSPLEGVALEQGTGVLLLDVEAAGDAYSVEVPYKGQIEWSADLQPKRFCFEEPDRRPHAYAVPTRVVVDCS